MTSSTTNWSDPVPYTQLSERQQEIMRFLWDCASSYSPSMREIGEAVGLATPSAVSYQLDQLEAKGWVRRHPRYPRALEWRGPDWQPPVRPELPRIDYLRAHLAARPDQDPATVDASQAELGNPSQEPAHVPLV